MSPAARTRSAAGAALLMALLVGGCTATAPPADLATRHVGAPSEFAELSRAAMATSGAVTSDWLRRFDDPALAGLVQEAWSANPDLYVAAARFEEATARLHVVAAALYPQVEGFARSAYADGGDVGGSGGDEYAVGAGVSWEIDLWGRLRADRDAAEAVASASGLDFVQARHSLAAAVVEAYYAIVTARQQVAIDQSLLEAERFTAVTTRQRVEVGLGTTLDLDLADASVRLAESAVEDDLSALADARRALEILLGRYPSGRIDVAPELVPALPPGAVAVGVPSALLERRPDVRSAERLVDAAYQEVHAARAAQLPRLTLSADAATLIDPSEFATAVAADILAPLFEGGRLRAEVAAATARQRQATGAFAAVALRAFREVEGALSRARYLAELEESLTAASARLRRANEAATDRYDHGLMTILDLQQVRREDFRTRSTLLGVRFERLRQRLALELALGGPVGPVDDVETIEALLPGDQFADPDAAPLSGDLHVGEPTERTAPRTEHDDVH